MQQEQTGAAGASFAGLMAALTAARASAVGGLAVADGLEEDVATLSYERALQTHARYRPSEATPAVAAAGPDLASSGHRRLDASITVRMSRAECAQLQQRAAEAGMTVSAYLRSCTLEVESLRAQVKQTLAELREEAQPAVRKPARLGWLRVLRRKAAD